MGLATAAVKDYAAVGEIWHELVNSSPAQGVGWALENQGKAGQSKARLGAGLDCLFPVSKRAGAGLATAQEAEARYTQREHAEGI